MNDKLWAAIWWTVGAPALLYYLIEGTMHVRTENQTLLIGFLAVGGGFIAFRDGF